MEYRGDPMLKRSTRGGGKKTKEQLQQDLIDKANAGNKIAIRKLAEQFKITKVYSQEEIDSR
jgi:hypothetical protein